MSSFLSSFLTRHQETPERVQFVLDGQDGGLPVTHAMLFDGGQRYAALLHRLGTKPGSVVFIALTPVPDLLYAFIGAIMAGCVPAMMPFPSAKQDAAKFWESHDRLFRHIGGGVMVTYPENAAVVHTAIAPGVLTVTTPDAAVETDVAVPLWDWDGRDVCCLQHSSGTTGLKKGVTLTSNAIRSQIDSYADGIHLADDDVIVSWLPLYHDMGFVATFLLPLVTGVRSVIMSPFTWLSQPLRLFDLIAEHRGTHIWLPNFAFNHLANSVDHARRVDLSAVKAFINCSEPCKPASFDRFHTAFADWGVVPAQLQTCYAMAEAVFAVSQSRIGLATRICHPSAAALRRHELVFDADDPVALLSVGEPLPGIMVRIAGDSAIGEIQLQGSFVFDGYFRRDSTDCFEDGWYRTGDLGFLQDGELYVLGRMKDLIILLGKNFYAHEIEEIITEIPGVKPGRAVAFGLYNDAVGSDEGYIVVERDDTVPDADLRRSIKNRLMNLLGLVPKKIVIVEQGWLVKSTSGKISRSDNATKYLAQREAAK